MTRNRIIEVRKILVTLMISLLLFGCQLPKDKMSSASKDIDTSLQEASNKAAAAKKQTTLN